MKPLPYILLCTYLLLNVFNKVQPWRVSNCIQGKVVCLIWLSASDRNLVLITYWKAPWRPRTSLLATLLFTIVSGYDSWKEFSQQSNDEHDNPLRFNITLWHSLLCCMRDRLGQKLHFSTKWFVFRYVHRWWWCNFILKLRLSEFGLLPQFCNYYTFL